MRSDIFAFFGTTLALVASVVAAPQHGQDNCGQDFVTVYVTVSLPAGSGKSPTAAIGSLPMSPYEPVESSPGTTSIAYITSTMEQTVLVTATLTRSGQGHAETVDIGNSPVTPSVGGQGPDADNAQVATPTSSLKTFADLGPSVMFLSDLSSTSTYPSAPPAALDGHSSGPPGSPSVLTLKNTMISYKVNSHIPAATITSSSDSTDSTDSVVVVYETISVIPVPVGYKYPSVSSNQAPGTMASGTTSEAGFTSSGAEAMGTTSSETIYGSSSNAISSVASSGTVGPLPGVGSSLGGGGWNSTTCTGHATKNGSPHKSSLPIVPVPTTTSSSSSDLSRTGALASSGTTVSHLFVYPTLSSSASSTPSEPSVSASSTSSSVTTSERNIDDSGLTTLASLLASSSIAASGSTINDSGLATSSIAANSATSSPASMPASYSSSSVPASSDSSISTFMTSIVSSSTSMESGSATGATSASGSIKVTSSTSSSVSPTSCGEVGDFTLDFDDIPPLAAPSDTPDPMPIFSPYHQLYFDSGFFVVPPPTDPYVPASGKLLLQYMPKNGSKNLGEISNDYTEFTGCFNFNARGASLGCNSRGPKCDWKITGLRYNFTTNVEDEVASQIMSTQSCPSLKDCPLIKVIFDDTFKNMTSLRIHGTVAGIEQIWWMDSVDLSWYDNSCQKGLCRAGFRGRK